MGRTRHLQATARSCLCSDFFTATDGKLDADRWYQVAMTGEPTPDSKWRVRLDLAGRLVHEGTTKKLAAPVTKLTTGLVSAACVVGAMMVVGMNRFWPFMLAIVVATIVGSLLGSLVCRLLFRSSSGGPLEKKDEKK